MRLPRPLRDAFDALLAELRILRSGIQQLVYAVHEAGERDKQEEHPTGEVRVVKVGFTDEVAEERRSDQNRQYRLQKSIKNATWSAFIAATIYAAIAALQWHTMNRTYREIQKQTSAAIEAAAAAKSAADTAASQLLLTKQAFAATSAAICLPSVNSRDHLPFMYFFITCQASRVDATLLRGQFDVSLRNLQTGKLIGDIKHFTLEKQLMRPVSSSAQVNFDVANFSEAPFYSLKQEIVIEGSFEYADGFDRNIPVKFCKTILPFRSSNGQYKGMEPLDCVQADDKVREYREADEQAHP